MIIAPQNYFVHNPARQTVQQGEIDYDAGEILNIKKFGHQQAICTLDMVSFYLSTLMSLRGPNMLTHHPGGHATKLYRVQGWRPDHWKMAV